MQIYAFNFLYDIYFLKLTSIFLVSHMYGYRPTTSRPKCYGVDNGSPMALSMLLGNLSQGPLGPWGFDLDQVPSRCTSTMAWGILPPRRVQRLVQVPKIESLFPNWGPITLEIILVDPTCMRIAKSNHSKLAKRRL